MPKLHKTPHGHLPFFVSVFCFWYRAFPNFFIPLHALFMQENLYFTDQNETVSFVQQFLLLAVSNKKEKSKSEVKELLSKCCAKIDPKFPEFVILYKLKEVCLSFSQKRLGEDR